MGNGAPQNQKAVAVLWCRMLQFQRWTAYHEPIMISCFRTGHYFHHSHWVFLFQTIYNNHDHLLSCTTCGISPLNSSLLCRNENLSTAELRWGRQTSAIYIIQCAKLLSIPPTNPAETQWVWREWRINNVLQELETFWDVLYMSKHTAVIQNPSQHVYDLLRVSILAKARRRVRRARLQRHWRWTNTKQSFQYNHFTPPTDQNQTL